MVAHRRKHIHQVRATRRMSHRFRRQQAIRHRLMFALMLVIFTLSLEYRYHAFLAAKLAELTGAAIIYFILFGIMEV